MVHSATPGVGICVGGVVCTSWLRALMIYSMMHSYTRAYVAPSFPGRRITDVGAHVGSALGGRRAIIMAVSGDLSD